MAVPKVNKQMLKELESMGFPTVRAIRGLHFSGQHYDTFLFFNFHLFPHSVYAMLINCALGLREIHISTSWILDVLIIDFFN